MKIIILLTNQNKFKLKYYNNTEIKIKLEPNIKKYYNSI